VQGQSTAKVMHLEIIIFVQRCRLQCMIKSIIIGLIILGSPLFTSAQVKKIPLRGILTTKNGDAIPGCNVLIKGESTSTTTEPCGEFNIEVPENYEGTLVFSCMTPRVWEIVIKELKNKEKIIISMADWLRFENGPVEKNYKKEERIKIR
jgi:hypothetical protein